MKNLHVLPYEKQPVKGDLLLRHIWKGTSNECISWWRYNDTIVIDDVLQYTTLNGSFRDITSSFKVQNIHIISDEEIKDGDYYLYLKDNSVHKFIYKHHIKLLRLDIQKKIILTTDQELIKDGVQAIDDEFLEWFVKNPSCEKVEVAKMLYTAGSNHKGNRLNTCKIIIPKEEPTIEEEYLKDELKKYDGIDVVVLNKPEEPKQETLEEVAERYSETHQDVSENLEKYLVRAVFQDGAKWQAERMYSDNEVIQIICDFKYDSVHIGDMNPEKWFEHFKKK